MVTVELILFAIQAAVRLAKTGRRIYVEDTASRELVIPLPAGFSSPLATAREHATSLRLNRDPRYAAEFKEAFDLSFRDDRPEAEVEAARQDLIQLYLLDAARGRVPAIRLEQRELAGLAALKQWGEGESPFPHPLQRAAGALVEVAVDYFVNVPGAINEGSRSGKTIKAILLGLSELDLNVQEARWDSLVVGLFTAGLDALKENPDLLTDEEDTRSLIRQIVGGVAGDLKERLRQNPLGDLDAEAGLARCGQLVLRSLLRHGGGAVVQNPAILGLQSGAGRVLVSEVGSTFLSILLDGGEELPFSEALASLASTQSFDRLVRASLKAVAEHPDYFRTGNQSVDVWLKEVLTDLHKSWPEGLSFFDADLYAHTAYLLIEKGLAALPDLLKADARTEALLVTTTTAVFRTLTVPPAGNKPARWDFHLGRSDLEGLVAGVAEAIAAHPSWVTDDPKLQKALPVLIPLVVRVIGEADGDLLRVMVRRDTLRQLLEALLASGLLGDLAREDHTRLAEVVKLMYAALLASGTADLAGLLDRGAVTDLARALAGHPGLEQLLGEEPAARLKMVEAVAGLVQDLRGGKTLTIPEMKARLVAALGDG